MEICTLGLILTVILGLIAGSFLNVCIYRIPRSKSIISPGSHCPLCNGPIKWYDNIPLISYFLLLRGRCRSCGGDISLRYPLTEALTGLMFGVFFYSLVFQAGEPLSVYVAYSVLGCALLVSSFVDLESYIIPNEITYFGMVFGPVYSLLFPVLHHSSGSYRGFGVLEGQRLDALASSLGGMLVAGGLVLGFAVLGQVVFRQEAMGMGDVKLMAMIGGVTGWKLAVMVFFIAPFFALLVNIPLLLKGGMGGGHKIPYAPFLSLAALVSIPLQEPLIRFLDSRIHIFSLLWS
ncbi:MAG: prepilin peptidase [Candidatus Brocadiales bacterium]